MVEATHPCVGLDFIDDAPFRLVTSAEFPVLPAQLFEVLSETPAWPEWFDVTRIILMRGKVTAVEEFIAWKASSHLAFRFNECSDPRVRASAEEYRIEPTAQGCQLTSTMAPNPVGASRFPRWVARRVMMHTYRRALVSLRRYTEQRFGTVL